MLMKKGKRIAIVGGCRTAFVKPETLFSNLTAIDLGKIAVTELLNRLELHSELVEEVFFGLAMPQAQALNPARDIALRSGIPLSTPACTVNLACASSNQGLICAAESIALGNVSVAVAGGTESASDAPIFVSGGLRETLLTAGRAKTRTAKLKALSRLRLQHLKPEALRLAEPVTGQSMGDLAEKMAKENGISRADQDAVALRSHQRAWQAAEDGRLKNQIVRAYLPPQYSESVVQDNAVRADISPEMLAELPPAFDPRYGSVTTGNSSAVADGAAALLIMGEERAKSLGYRPLGYLRSYAVAGLAPTNQLLMGPVYAIPVALERAKVAFHDIELFEMQEAFAAQLLSNIGALASNKFAQEVLGRKQAVGEVDMEKLNVCGGSIAIGHPVAATGGRLVLNLLEELQRRQKQFGLVAVCTAGAMGVAMVFETGD